MQICSALSDCQFLKRWFRFLTPVSISLSSVGMARQFIGYYRVSTDRQGRSALGLEAQREAVAQFVRQSGGVLLAEYTEVESGRRNDRPELDLALKECRARKATLAIARLDRLARNATFLLQLRDSSVEFAAADMPNADRFIVGILALVAERERDLISARTKEALAAAKRRGVKLGSPTPVLGSSAGVEAIKRNVATFDLSVLPTIRHAQQAGARSLRAIAKILNDRGIATRRDRKWSPEAVRLCLLRADRTPDKSENQRV